jgi:hypothetical protein
MKKAWIVFLALAAAAGCNRNRTDKVETEVKTERDAAGNIVKTEAQAAGRQPGGARIDAENRIYIGKVTKLEAGKSLEIVTEDGDSHTFDLKEKDTQVTVQPSVEIGRTVEVIIEKQKDQPKKLSVIPRVR